MAIPVAENTGNPVQQWYFHWAEREPLRPALITERGSIPYADLGERIRDRARRFDSMGVGPGTRVVWDARCAGEEWVVGLIAGLAVGAGMVLPDPAWPETTRSACLAPLLPAGGEDPDRGEAGVWLFTSGTTGIPKARHRTVAQLGEMADRVLSKIPRPLREGHPVSLCIVPLYHGYGLVNVLLLIHALGGTVVLENNFRPRRAAQLIGEYGVEVLFGTRALYLLLANPALWQAGEGSSLLWCVNSTGWIEQEVARRFAECTGCSVRQQYGTTETGPLCLDSEPSPSGLEYCVGLPLPGVVIGVRDEDGRVLPPGHSGRLVVRFDNGWAPPLERADEGFFRLEDTGMLDDQGRVFVYHDPARWRRWAGGGASTGEKI